jgi:hypothetical protein
VAICILRSIWFQRLTILSDRDLPFFDQSVWPIKTLNSRSLGTAS